MGRKAGKDEEKHRVKENSWINGKDSKIESLSVTIVAKRGIFRGIVEKNKTTQQDEEMFKED